MDQTQSILPHLSHDDATMCVFKQHFEYKSFYMLENVCPNMVMVTLQNLIETPLYKNLNITIHHQWTSFFDLHMNSKFKFLLIIINHLITLVTIIKKIHYTPPCSMIHNFLNVPKMMDYENTICFIAQIKKFTF